MQIEETQITVAPPNTRLTISENKYCVILNGTVTIKTSSSLKEIGTNSIFQAEGIIYSGENGCKIIAFDPTKHRLPFSIRRKLWNFAEKKRYANIKNESSQKHTNQLIYNKNFCCPVCETKFRAEQVRFSKLKLVKRDPDLRMHYEKIDPLMYNVILCPQCFYANFAEDFNKITPVKKSKLLSTTRMDCSNSSPCVEKTAIENHKLALECIKIINGTPGNLAKSYLHLAWLYEDINEKTLAKEMREYALTYYKQAYSSSPHLNSSQVQQIIYLIAELSLQLGYNKDAYEFFQQLIREKEPIPWLLKLGRERLLDLRNKISDATNTATN